MKSKSAEIKILDELAKNIDSEINSIIQEHDNCFPGSSESVSQWFQSLPIETLEESINFDLKKSPSKYSLKDMKHKFNLRRLYGKKIEELEKVQSEMSIAKIDLILENIKKIS